ncbi:unnamed protein product [Choristocarpus tenellus]
MPPSPPIRSSQAYTTGGSARRKENAERMRKAEEIKKVNEWMMKSRGPLEELYRGAAAYGKEDTVAGVKNLSMSDTVEHGKTEGSQGVLQATQEWLKGALKAAEELDAAAGQQEQKQGSSGVGAAGEPNDVVVPGGNAPPEPMMGTAGGGDREEMGARRRIPERGVLRGKKLVQQMKNVAQYVVVRSTTAEEAYADLWEAAMEIATKATEAGCGVPTGGLQLQLSSMLQHSCHHP